MLQSVISSFSNNKKSVPRGHVVLDRKQELLDAHRHLLGSSQVELVPRAKKAALRSSLSRRSESPLHARPGARGIVLPAILSKLSLGGIGSTLSTAHLSQLVADSVPRGGAVQALFPAGRGRARGAMAAIPAALLSLLLVGACLFIGLSTMSLELSAPLEKLGLGQLIGFGMAHPLVDRFVFRAANVLQYLGFAHAGNANAAWFATLSKPAFYPWGHSSAKIAGLSVVYASLVIACFRLLTARTAAGQQNRLVALALFGAQLAHKSLWAVFRLGFRSTLIGLVHRAVQFALVAATTRASFKVDRRAGLAMAVVAAWSAYSLISGAGLWYYNH